MNSILAGFEVKEAKLDNGLRVLVREDHSAPVVAIFTHVNAGYFDEADERIGISHVLEHMFFKGTPARGPGEIAQQTKSAGGYLNASTIYDHTSYYTVLPASALADGLDIQSDALINSLIDEEELRKELLVIIQEANRKLDNPAAVARETLYEMMFDCSRMRRWRIGREEQLRGYDRSAVAEFFETHYRAPTTLLIVAGAVDASDVFELARQKYARLRAGEPPRDRGPKEPDSHEFRYREIAGDVVQTRLEVGWHTPAILHPDTVPLDMLALILGQGRASHLYRKVREAGLATGVSAHNYTPTELGVFGVTAESEPADARRCLIAVFDTIATAQAGAITDEDVARAQSVMEARTLRGLETMEGQAGFVAHWAALGDWRLGVEYLDRVLSVTRADVERVAREYLRPEVAAVLSYRPESAPGMTVTLDDVNGHARDD
jgi:zinc protease